MKVYVINLDRRPDRRKSIEDQLKAINLSPIWISAIDGQADHFYDTYKLTTDNSKLKRGEIACYLSHISALKLIAASADDYAAVLEDDAILATDFGETVRNAAKLLNFCPIIRLSALKSQNGHLIKKMHHNRTIILPTKSISGTQGYLISKRGASEIIPKIQNITLPIDTVMDRY
jgi:glycosyl transferase family 25